MARWHGYIFSFCLTWAVMARLIFSMLAIALILLPDFSLILLGLLLRRRFAYPAEFWGHLERLVYYLMFPALLFRAVSRTELDIAPALDMFIAGFGFSVVGIVLGVLGRWLFKPDGRVFASCVQTGFRFNTYIGLAVVDRLSGHAGIASFAVLIGVMVPWVNAVSVWFLARQGGASVWRELAKNPLIVATLSGFIVSLFGLPLPGEVNHVLDLLAAAALPLGLLSVGAGLRAEGLRASLPLVNYFTFVKLVALPAAAWGLALLLGLKGLYFQSVLVLAALPTASSAYILAVRMGGDGRTVATIITVNVFVAMVTLPLWLGLAL